ncbi:hypothetical protein AgCh_028563 [Apium graveolens]
MDMYVDTVVDKAVEPSVQMQPHEGKSVAETTVVEVRAQTLPAGNPYEEIRKNRVLENRAKFKELGLNKYLPDPNQPTVHINKKKNQVEEESDEYILEDEIEEEDSEDSPKSAKKKKIPPGPRTRSRANDMNLDENDPVPATREKASKKVPSKEGVESSCARKLLNPTCSKLLKQCGDIQSGFIAAYVALRERQKQNLELEIRIEDFGESSLPNVVEEGEPAPKKFRGRSKMLKVHGRTANEKVFITLSKTNQPIGDKKVTSELSNFLGTLVKDHERYDIPTGGLEWINKTLNTCWRVHKSRIKKEHYTKYDTDEQRLENMPHEISLEDFKLLMKYWAGERV